MDHQTQDDPDDRTPDEEDPDLDHHERAHAGSGPTPPDARVIHEVIRADGEKELEQGEEMRRSMTSRSPARFRVWMPSAP